MKWIARCCWLAAWGVWFWLGFGLYRELPKKLGPRTCKLPIGSGNEAFGFVGETNLIAVQVGSYGPIRNLALFDAQSGNEVGRRPLPMTPMYNGVSVLDVTATRVDQVQTRNRSTLKYGCILGRNKTPGQWDSGLQSFDVLHEKWRRLTWLDVSQIELHPTKPWAAMVVGPEVGGANRIVVADYQRGTTLFDLKFPEKSTLYSRPFFVVDRDALVLPLVLHSKNGGGTARGALQVWKIAEPTILERELTENPRPPFVPYSVSSSGRMLFNGNPKYTPTGSDWVDVFDLNDQSFLTTLPPSEQPKISGIVHFTIDPLRSLIAPNGRTVLKFGSQGRQQVSSDKVTFKIATGTLREVGSGRTIWEASPKETVVEASQSEGFVVAEQFHDLWKQWFPNLKFETRALRGLEAGELLLRTPGDVRFDARNSNANKTLVLLNDGSVHRLPFLVDWPLLTFCQAVLAVPVILFWVAVSWRRKRRARAGEEA